ncbi:MAG TPA: tetratricopeptide repeat protein [Blastocatellia bacterium]|nr:tetratricopeptide repeat protein [Blastocatellia bacterium]
MQNAANTSRFLTDSSSNRIFVDLETPLTSGGMLHRVLLGRVAQAVDSCQSLIELANTLIRLAEHAYSRRETDRLEEVSLILMNLPVAGARQIGLYYHALTLKRNNRIRESQSLLESVVDNAPVAYRARAIQSLGVIQHSLGKPAEALRCFLESLRAASDQGNRDLLTTLYAYVEISHIQSDDGDHAGALKTLEKTLPLVRMAASQYPFYYYNHWANTAFELGETGRVTEAKAALSIALAWPSAQDYPEWFETRAELEAKQVSATPSTVAVKQLPEPYPAPQQSCEPDPQTAHARAVCQPEAQTILFLVSGITVVAAKPIARFPISRTTLDRLGRSFSPRAPPAHS